MHGMIKPYSKRPPVVCDDRKTPYGNVVENTWVGDHFPFESPAKFCNRNTPASVCRGLNFEVQFSHFLT